MDLLSLPSKASGLPMNAYYGCIETAIPRGNIWAFGFGMSNRAIRPACSVSLYKLKLDDTCCACHRDNHTRGFYHHFVADDPYEVHAISGEDRLT